MKKFLSILGASIFVMLFINSCTEEVEGPSKKLDIVVMSDKAADGTLPRENISINIEKLYYKPGSVITFSGRLFDAIEKGISDAQISIDDPVLLKSLLSVKTDKEGRFIYKLTLPSIPDGVYAFVFYYNETKVSVKITVSSSNGSAPGAPSNPKPENGATNVSLNPVLSWTAKDPDGDPIKCSVWFGENTSAPQKVSDLTGTEFKPGKLEPGKKYFWKVVANDGKDGEASGGWWSFTTEKPEEKPANKPPSAPSNPKPENKAVNVSLNPVLSWIAKDPDGDALKYVIYFGESTANAKKTDQTSSEFKPGKLEPGKTYYWKVVAFDGKGGETSGDWWSFTTEKPAEKPANNPPAAPSNPKPEKGAINISLNPVLSWTGKDPDGDALKYVVYFGDTPNTALKKVEQSGTEFKPGTLAPGKTYYWKVVAYDGKGGETASEIWSFTTEKAGEKPANKPPYAPSGPKPENKAINVSLNPVLSWTGKDPDGDALKYVVYFGDTPNTALKKVEQSGAEFKPGTLERGKTYYWKVVASDGKGGESVSDIWSFTTEK